MEPYWSDELTSLYHCDVFDLAEIVGPFAGLITDPPYSSGGAFRGDRVAASSLKYSNAAEDARYKTLFGGDNRDQRSYLAWSMLWMLAFYRRMVEGGVLLCFTDWRQLPTVTDAVQAAGFVYRGIGVWDKTYGRPHRGVFRGGAEYVVHGSVGAISDHKYFPHPVFESQRIAQRSRLHIAEKPVSVMEWLCKFVPPGGVVVDPFCGSGSTLVAARRLGLPSVGADIDPECLDITIRRLQQGALNFDQEVV